MEVGGMEGLEDVLMDVLEVGCISLIAVAGLILELSLSVSSSVVGGRGEIVFI